jgi:hypothetical protein
VERVGRPPDRAHPLAADPTGDGGVRR